MQRERARIGGTHDIDVSILTHLVGWVQQDPRASARPGRRCFNPHPPGRVGATRPIRVTPLSVPVFQSSPTWSGGCNQRPVAAIMTFGQMFQSSPTWSGGCNPIGPPATCPYQPSFNPHPPGRVGATWRPPVRRWTPPRGFNPHPPGRVGATRRTVDAGSRRTHVSILTHLVGWVQRSRRNYRRPATARFNPHPPGRVGATSVAAAVP